VINPRSTRRRLALSVLLVFAIVAGLGFRLVDIQVVRAEEISAGASDHRSRQVTVYGTRGSIVDASGVVLADSVQRFDITASPRNVDFVTTSILRDDDGDGESERVTVPTSEAIEAIAAITGDDAAEMMAALTDALADNPLADFAYLSRKVKLEQFEQVKALGISWVYNEQQPARSYPNGAVAGNLVGFLGTDEPLAGVENYMNECLAATNGSSLYEAGADGVALPGTTYVDTEPVDGATVRLTIDSDLQWFAQQTLASNAEELGAAWATAMVVRVSDGYIMAAADWPSVDPNDLNSLPAEDMGARSFTSPYEPGSIIKPFTFASLLDAGKVSVDESILVPATYTEGLPAGKVITDAWWHGEVRWTAAGILADSSNIGTSMLSTRLDAEDRREYLLGFGFNTQSGVDFLGEEPGTVLPLDRLDSITNVTQQFGQGMAATSAQVASAYQALGNGGVHVPLTLVEGCEWPDGTVTNTPSAESTRVVSESAANDTVSVMEQVITQGSLSSIVSFPGYRVAAKTGTAEIAENGVYGDERIVSIAGMVPADDPEYVVVVTIAKPDTMRTSAAAAPAFETIMQQVIKAFRIAPSSESAPFIPLTW
tara:strand:- start:6384 stop:8180 length:1797 start_codon:yes stop_codon:yes gene_type:complete